MIPIRYTDDGIPVYRFPPEVEECIKANATRIHAEMWKEYRDAGMPYGDTHEGMMRWHGEQQ